MNDNFPIFHKYLLEFLLKMILSLKAKHIFMLNRKLIQFKLRMDINGMNIIILSVLVKFKMKMKILKLN